MKKFTNFLFSDKTTNLFMVIVLTFVIGVLAIRHFVKEENKAKYNTEYFDEAGLHMYITIYEFAEEFDCVYIVDSVGNRLIVIDLVDNIMDLIPAIDYVNKHIESGDDILLISEEYANQKYLLGL